MHKYAKSKYIYKKKDSMGYVASDFVITIKPLLFEFEGVTLYLLNNIKEITLRL